MHTYTSSGGYGFHGGREVFKQKTGKAGDAAYSKVRVTGKDAAGADLRPVIAEVARYAYWELGARKTRHATAPDGFTQAKLTDYAAAAIIHRAERPRLLIGDSASVTCGDVDSTDWGISTDLAHRFGAKGFFTDFSVDSGGVTTEGADYIATRNAALSGFNRKQTLAGPIGLIDNK